MTIADSLRLSLTVLRANKRRTILTSLGIIIGIAAVVIIMSVGAGAQSLIIGQLNAVGSNLIGVLPGASDENGPPASALGINVETLTYDDARAIGATIRNVAAVSAYVTGVGTVTYQNQTSDATYYGVMADYPEVEDVTLAYGRFLTPEEERGTGRVVVIGHQVWQDLFAGQDPIGATIKIRRHTFEVIGVFEERGTAGFQNQDNVVYMPLTTAQDLLLGIDHVNFIRIKAADAAVVEQVAEDARLLLRDRHDIAIGADEDFSVRNTQDAIEALTTITDALRFFLAAIASLSLLVGGVGVMNIMLAAVTERIREIGLRKAVGARRGDISRQFIFETLAITSTGGVIGILIGVSVAAVVAVVAQALGYDWSFVVTPSSIIVGCVVSVLVGLAFGVYPARRAARLDPITALRYE